MRAPHNAGCRLGCHVSLVQLWPLFLCLLGSAAIADSRALRLTPRSVTTGSRRHILASVQAGNPGCPKGEVGWANCGSALDTKSQTCINGHTCSLGEQLCGVTCYDPAQLGCTGGTLSSTPGASDGSETRNCTSPEPHMGPVGCNGDGCPIETGPPVAPAPAPLTATTRVSTSTAGSTAASAVALGSTGSGTTSTKGGKDGVNVGAIVAGSIGAVVLLAVIGGVVIVFVRRRRRTTKALEFKEMKKEVPFENMPGQADMNPSHAVY